MAISSGDTSSKHNNNNSHHHHHHHPHHVHHQQGGSSSNSNSSSISNNNNNNESDVRKPEAAAVAVATVAASSTSTSTSSTSPLPNSAEMIGGGPELYPPAAAATAQQQQQQPLATPPNSANQLQPQLHQLQPRNPDTAQGWSLSPHHHHHHHHHPYGWPDIGGQVPQAVHLEPPPTYAPLVKVEPPASASSALASPTNLGHNHHQQTLLPPLAVSHAHSPIIVPSGGAQPPAGGPTTLMGAAGSGGGDGARPSSTSTTMISTECSCCGDLITDRFILQVANRSWHAGCLRCHVCHTLLDGHTSCFLREDLLYCKLDYTKLFGAKCYKCCRMISPTDWVRKAKDQVYHLACFACDSCKRQLSTGEEFGINENRVLCKAHYMEIVDGGCTSSDAESGESESHSKKKTKRMRTTFTEEQVQILQANFQIDSNPDGQDLERIAQITGLSKRVTQVWFQNCRARQKKYMNSGKRGGGSSGASKAIALAGMSPVSRDRCTTPQMDLHVMYSTFRTQPPASSASSGPPPSQAPSDTNPDGDLSQDSNGGSNPGYMRAEV